MTAPLAVLLSTYNGERFLAEQLDSLLRQTWRDFIIIARDDGSSDGSRALLGEYAAKHPERFRLLPGGGGNLGACASFAHLLGHALERGLEPGPAPDSGLRADTGAGPDAGVASGASARSSPAPGYFLFCDQDDIWHDDKIERQMALMRQTEAGDASLPVLVHSDLEVVDAENRPIAPSFTAYQGLNIERNGFTGLAISNLVTGCTALINRALARRALPIPPEAIMHDWWLALAASAFGKLAYSAEPTVRYRQHDANTIGAKLHTPLKLTRLAHWRPLLFSGPNPYLLEVGRQARAFLARHGDQLHRKQRGQLRLCSLLRLRQGIMQRIIFRLAQNR